MCLEFCFQDGVMVLSWRDFKLLRRRRRGRFREWCLAAAGAASPPVSRILFWSAGSCTHSHLRAGAGSWTSCQKAETAAKRSGFGKLPTCLGRTGYNRLKQWSASPGVTSPARIGAVGQIPLALAQATMRKKKQFAM